MTKDLKAIQREVFSPEFTNYCRKNIVKDLLPLEKKRKNYITAIILIWVLSIVLAFGYVFYSFLCLKNNSIDLIPALVLASTIASCLQFFIIKFFKYEAKKIVLPRLISYIGEFEVKKGFLYGEYSNYLHNLKLIPNFNQFSHDDCLVGKYNNVNLEIIEIDLKREIKHKDKKSVQNIFKGLFIKFESFKKFKGYTVIKKDGIKLFAGKERVTLEDPVFEKYFDVQATDQIEARYLITPAFMNRLLELNSKKIGKNITMSFEHGNVNIAVPSEKDWFEVPFFKPVTEIDNYREIVVDLLSILSIIDVLKLDENIGM